MDQGVQIVKERLTAEWQPSGEPERFNVDVVLPAALGAISAQIANEPDDGRVGRLVVEQVAALLQARYVCLALLDNDPAWLVVHQATERAASRAGTRQPSDQGVLGRVVRSADAFLAVDFAQHPLAADEPDAADLRSVLAVPLRFKGEVLGAVLAARGSGQPAFAAADQLTLQVLADLAGTRLYVTHQVAALRTRAAELAVMAPEWRPPPAAAGEFVLIVKNRKAVIDADAAACRILDYSREALLQRTLADLVPMPPWGDQVDTLGSVREQMLSGAVVTFDSIIRRRVGGLLPVRMHLRGIRVPDGFVTRGVFEDLSAEKQAQVEAIQVEKMRLLTEIGSGLAHQINTPLAIVMGNTELLLDELADPEQRALLQPVHDAAQRIHAAVQDLQRFARPIVPSAWAPVDLSALARETVEQTRPLWESAPRTEGRVIALRLETADLPTLQANPIELQEAVRELLDNAVHALPQGGTIVVRTESGDGQVRLIVADDGVGMTEEVRLRCIEPFFTLRRPAANGLGLNRVYHAVQRHRGHLQIDSAPEQGTRITIALPLASSE